MGAAFRMKIYELRALKYLIALHRFLVSVCIDTYKIGVDLRLVIFGFTRMNQRDPDSEAVRESVPETVLVNPVIDVTFNWTLTAASGTTAPTITDPGTQSGTAGGSVSLPISAHSAAGALAYSVDQLPDGLSIDAGIISGTLTSNAVGTTSTTVTVIDRLGGTASGTFSWMVAPAPLTLSANALTAAKGIATGPVTVGTFTTMDLSAVASNYAATINWGDGNSSAARIDRSNGTFTVYASHTYASAGTYVLALTVSQADGTFPTSATATASVLDTGGAGPVALQGFDIVVQANGDVNAGQVAATFQDNNPSHGAGGVYTAMLYGSDGSVSNGVVTGMYTLVGQRGRKGICTFKRTKDL